MLIGDEQLDYSGQYEAIKSLQGQHFAHGPKAARENHLDSIIMRPRELRAGRHRALIWSVGRKIGVRVSVSYDDDEDRLHFDTIDDPGIHYSDFIAIPRLGALAVDDRSGAPHLGGKAAIGRFRSIFRTLEDGEVNIQLTTSPQDVRRALDQWKLTEFSFIVRPFNPHPPSELARRLSEQFQKDKIGTFRGRARPNPGDRMQAADDGEIAAVTDLADAGYGQYSFRGETEDGHDAQIKQPRFDRDQRKNQMLQSRQRELRVLVATEDLEEEEVFQSVAKALVKFYGEESTET